MTIEDVAARAQVSVATVSRALRGLPNVAPATRRRVLEAARELRYVADPSASRLASGRSVSVGVVVPALARWYYASAVAGVERVLSGAGYDLLPYTTGGRQGRDRSLETLPFRKRVDGLVVVDAPLPANRLRRIVDEGVEVVTVGFRTDVASSLTVANVAAARLAVGHLTGLGHRRVALVGASLDGRGDATFARERGQGYREALAAADLEVDAELTVPGGTSLEDGAEAMQRLLHLAEPPTAVFAVSDELAIGAAQVARDAGLRVPEEVSVVGFDDHDVAAYVGLTTVRQDVGRIGERAAELLLQRLRDDDDAVVHEVLPTRLVVRRSTGPPPRGRRRRR